MNLIPSLLIYNPLEALVIILLLSFVSNTNLSCKSIFFNSYLLGSINLLFQFLVECTYGLKIYPLLSIFLGFIITPFIIYEYNKYIICFQISFVSVYLISIYFHFSTIIIVLLLNDLYIIDIFLKDFVLNQEFLMNMYIRIPQLIILGILNLTKRWAKNEKFLKKHC